MKEFILIYCLVLLVLLTIVYVYFVVDIYRTGLFSNKSKIKNIKKAYDQCYLQQENLYKAATGLCNGLNNGNVLTDILNCRCVDCPHFEEFDKLIRQRLAKLEYILRGSCYNVKD